MIYYELPLRFIVSTKKLFLFTQYKICRSIPDVKTLSTTNDLLAHQNGSFSNFYLFLTFDIKKTFDIANR